jgi:acetoin utilization protein AcuC
MSACFPIGGLHHARRDSSAGFCVFNDLGVTIETLRSDYVKRVAYVDIDVHHGDGAFYAYESDPDLIFADIHEDGHYLYPGTGHASETGKQRKGPSSLSRSTGRRDRQFLEAWPRVVTHPFQPQFVFHRGADAWREIHGAFEIFPHPCHAARSLCYRPTVAGAGWRSAVVANRITWRKPAACCVS